MDKEKLSKMIDHTLLKADATSSQIRTICEEALENNFATVCVNPVNVSLCNEILYKSSVGICTVVGFPLGASTTQVKSYETSDAISLGATEIDMVINIGALKSGKIEIVKKDIEAVVNTAGKVKVKVIIETALLSDREKELACEAARDAGASFVKTSTGFSLSGATTTDVALMRKVVGPNMGVKASGGVKTLEDMIQMIESGANRLGTSSGVSIIQSCNDK